MNRLSLQFAGVDKTVLIATLGLAIALAMLVFGGYKLLRRQRLGWLALAGGAVSAGLVVFAAAVLPLRSSAGRLAWLLLLGGVVVLAVSIFYWTVYAYLGRRRMTALLALRFFAIAALLLILFKPAVSVQPPEDKSKLALPVLLDRSASMDTIDAPDLPSRYRQSIEALLSQQEQIRRHFRPAFFHFARDVQAAEGPQDLAGLSPSGDGTDQTNIAAALQRAIAGYSTDELAGIILITDGQHNAESKLDQAVSAARVPIYCIGVGSENQTAIGRRNAQVVSVAAPIEAIRHNATTIGASILATGLANVPLKVSLLENDKEVDSKQLLAEGAAQTLSCQFKWTPGDGPAAGPDIRSLKVRIDPAPGEANTDDNTATFHVLVVQPSIRVLYVEGTMRPEAKFIHRALSTDPNVSIVYMSRVSGNKFTSQGSIDGKVLTDLPHTEDEFKAFDVIMLGDLDRTFLSNQQMEAIRKVVNDGKALLMIGGRNSFGPGGYADTPIEAALPVLVGPRSGGQETAEFVPKLTAEGAASPIFEGLGQYFDSPAAKATAPLDKLLGCVTLAKVKPGASVLAVHPDKSDSAGPLPVLVVQQYGSGRSAAFAADTTWKWYMQYQARGGQNPYHLFWGQMMRWGAGQDNRRQAPSGSVLARTERSAFTQGEQVKLSAQVKGPSGQLTRDAAVEASITGEGMKDPLRVKLLPAKDSTGLYEAATAAPKGGAYQLEISATDKDGKPIGKDVLPLISIGKNMETERLARDTALLKNIAAQSGGQFAELSALPDVVDQIVRRCETRLAPPPSAHNYNLYNFPLLFLAFVGLLTAEWLLRRNWQLQ